jgi:hypothetical protein
MRVVARTSGGGGGVVDLARLEGSDRRCEGRAAAPAVVVVVVAFAGVVVVVVVVVVAVVIVVVVIVGVIRAHGVADAIFGRPRRREVVLPIAARCFAIHVNIVVHLAGGGLMSDLHPHCLVIYFM